MAQCVQQKHGAVYMYLQGRLDVRDAASSSFLNEVAATLKELQSLCGDDFLAYLHSTAIPATKLPSNVQVKSTCNPVAAFASLRAQGGSA